MPAIERTASAPIRSLRGILNGTTNYVLDRVATGATLEEATRSAQSLGLAESDPSRDLDGRDALDKLAVLASIAGFSSKDAETTSEPIEPASTLDLTPDRRYRHVATLDATGAHVRLEHLDAADPLYDVPGEWNALVIERADGTQETIRGKGAGRWPTAEAVIADLLELNRTHARVPEGEPRA